MKAQMNYDKGVSTIEHSFFNYGGNPIGEITEEMVKDVLNFEIEKVPCYTENGEIIPRMNYLRRSDGGIIDANCSVGEEFSVAIQPSEIAEFAKFIMVNVPNVKVETVATIYNGGTAFINLTYGGQWLVKGDSSPHHTNVLIANPCSRGKVHLVAHSVRVVCCNTLLKSMKTGEGYRISHTTNSRAMMEQALEGMRYELSEANKTRQMCEFLASKEINSAQVNRILDMVYPLPEIKAGESTVSRTRMETKRNEVVAQFEKDDSFTEKTFYTFLNSFTYNIEHPLHKRSTVDSVQVAYENLTGHRAEEKSNILARVLAVAMDGETRPMVGNGGEVVEAEYTMAVA